MHYRIDKSFKLDTPNIKVIFFEVEVIFTRAIMGNHLEALTQAWQWL